MKRAIRAMLGAALIFAAAPGAVSAETPTPGGSSWSQDYPLAYRWLSGAVPPSWLQPLVHAAASDVNNSRASRAPTFSYSSSGIGTVAYNTGPNCGSGALACFRRYPTGNTFLMEIRRQGQLVSWGTIRWCHTYTSWPTGCFDAELSAAHEFGHIQVLDHNDLGTTYPATIMNSVQAANPSFGWNQHMLGRCDVARLQMTYDVQSWSQPISSCLSIPTTSTLSTSATSVRAGTAVTFTATVRTSTSSAYGRLADNPLHARTVVLQRAAIGGSSWIDVTTMSPAAAAGSYTRAVTINASYQWRVSFRPSGEGVTASTSSAMIVRIQ
jgi:hypothetical protein